MTLHDSRWCWKHRTARKNSQLLNDYKRFDVIDKAAENHLVAIFLYFFFNSYLIISCKVFIEQQKCQRNSTGKMLHTDIVTAIIRSMNFSEDFSCFNVFDLWFWVNNIRFWWLVSWNLFMFIFR